MESKQIEKQTNETKNKDTNSKKRKSDKQNSKNNSNKEEKKDKKSEKKPKTKNEITERKKLKNPLNSINEKPKISNPKKSKKCSLFSIIKKFFFRHKKSFFISIGVIVSIIVLLIVLKILIKNKEEEIKNNNDRNDFYNIQPIITSETNLKKEFNIITKIGDLKRFSVIQKSEEEFKTNSEIIITKILRKTIYDIYFKSVENASKENKKYYSKMYKGIISIRSECTILDKEDCSPLPLVDLTSESINFNQINSDMFKNNSIALCTFNITDNNVITTISCPEELPDNKRNEIILDLYFFRPPAVERADKKGDNISLTINYENGMTKIRETNGGYCNIFNNLNSKCTTDMNTTLDSEGNLIIYDEQAFTRINYDENNIYTKNKITNLKDVSENIKEKDLKNYENSIYNLLPLINPYMKEETQFTEKEYDDLYNVIKDKKYQDQNSSKHQNYIPKKTRNTFRNLKYNAINDNNQYIPRAELFTNKITPVQIDLDFKINTGINSEIMGAYGSIIFDDQEIVYSSIEEISIIQELIDKLVTFSKAGNLLASKLYDKINNKLEMITNTLSIQIKSLDDLLIYHDIYPVFNSTLINYSNNILPIEIIEYSNQLLSALSGIYYNMKSGSIKLNVDNLSDNIYTYIDELHELIDKILNNFSTLTKILLTNNNTYTQITNYYLNNTSSSYYNLIQKIKTIIDTYFIKEYEAIFPKINELIYLIELNSNETLNNELNSLQELYNNIKNEVYIIKSITSSQKNKVLSNLDNSYHYPIDIIKKLGNYINEVMYLKENGYFTSNGEINNLNNSFNKIKIEAEKVAKILDNVNIIDKVFDDIMIKFREGYIYTTKYMEQIKSGNFTLEENILNTSLFTINEKNRIEDNLKQLSDNVLNLIKQEKDFYNNKIKNYIEKFLDNDLDNLNEILTYLNALLSEETVRSIAQSFEISLNASLEKLFNITNNNIDLTKNYFDQYYKLLNNDTELINLLYNSDEFNQMFDFEEIFGKMRTTTYLSKFNSFMANFNYSEEYLSNQLYVDISNEYRKIYTKIKEDLQNIINNDLIEKYCNLSEFDFLGKHINIIDIIKTRIDTYFSSNIFEEKYLKIINESINTNINLIKSIKEYINEQHNYIRTFPSYEDNSNDICITYKRKICYGCTNCVSFTNFYDRYCFVLSPYEYNHIYLTKLSFDSLNDFNEYNLIFNYINNKIKEKNDEYNYIMNNLESNISLIKQETLKKNITKNYLKQINDYIELILKEKYENALLNSVYNFYKTNLELKLQNIFGDIFNKWENVYMTLLQDIKMNNESLTKSMFEFANMAEIYRTIIEVDLIENYYNSIILLERSELNYTISHYYNYFFKLIDKYYKYIIQKISKNDYIFNDILFERKNEIKNNFEYLLTNITNSEFNCINIENQLNLLNSNESDFFKIKYILIKYKKDISDTLDKITSDIFRLEMFLPDPDKYTLVMRYFLENKELGKLIEEYYDPIDRGEFFYLNIGKFKDIMNENWIFESEDFINIINNALDETNKEIKNEFNLKLNDYNLLVEYEINNFFLNIENIISNLFKNQFNHLFNTQKVNIINNIVAEILQEFEIKMIFEAQRIKNSHNSYILNSESIKNKIINYQEKINIAINLSIFDELDKFNEKIYNNIFVNFIEKKAIDYLNKVKNIILFFDRNEFKLLNSTFNLKEIIYDLIENIISNHKNILSKQINIKYLDYYQKIKTLFNLDSQNTIIKNNLLNIYQNILLKEIKPENNCTSNACPIFDFTQETKDSLENIISEKSTNIKNELSLTKNSNIEINLGLNIDFPISVINFLKVMYDSLKEFLSFENSEQNSKINEHIQNAILLNLDDFLDNVVPNYGNIFFERIIDYNINFKIVDLYENLYYGISKTLIYYFELKYVSHKIKDLPFDLKIRLYDLNGLESTLVNKLQEIKILLEKKLSELIIDLKNEAKKTYIQFIKQDELIKKSFSSNIIEIINFNLEYIMPEIEKKYQITLEKYLKEKFMNSFSEILEEKTENMIQILHEEKNKLIEVLDDLFSSTEDNDLTLVNKNINMTLESMQNYNNFLLNFDFSGEIQNYFLNFSKINLLPIFNKFDSDLNKKAIEDVVNLINNNSLTIENLTSYTFDSKAKSIYDEMFDNYINYINAKIFEYGNTELNYKSNLFKTIEQNEDNYKRRLVEYNIEDEIAEESKKRIESKYVEETLEQLVNKTRNVKRYVDTLNAFTESEKKIINFKTNLNIDYKNLKENILQKQYNSELEKFLNEKLNNLTSYLNNYYSQINSSYSHLKKDIINSIHEIKYSLDNITEITKDTLNSEYQKISDKTNRINKTITNYIKTYPEIIKYVQKSENMLTNVYASIKNLTEYGQFLLEFTLEGEKFKIPKIRAKIVDKTIPKNVMIYILSNYGFCYYKGYIFDIEFNDANFTAIIEYDIKSNYINITTYKNFEKYFYYKRNIENKGEMANEKITVSKYTREIECIKIEKNFSEPIKIEVSDKTENSTKIIDSIHFCSFCKKCDEGYFFDYDKCIKKCDIGENDKCNSCNPLYPQFCDSCNENYFLPENLNNTKCKKCEIENCLECIGNISHTQCIMCKDDYILSGGLCLKPCEIGANNKCLKCNDEQGKINQCSLCNNGYYLPENDLYNKTQCEKCLINGCMTCTGNLINHICIKCENNFISLYEDKKIISCIKKSYLTPDRIDIIKNGKLMYDNIEIIPNHVIKTQLSDSIKYYTSSTCTAKPSSYWWKPFEGNDACFLPIYFNISKILPKEYNMLSGDYTLYLNGTEKFTGVSNSPFREFSVSPYFYIICNQEFGNKYNGRVYCSDTFGIYIDLEKINNNGRIMLGGVYNRGRNFYQLEKFNYTTTVANGTQKIGWNFYVNAGDFGQVRGDISISFIIYDLYLIKINKNE